MKTLARKLRTRKELKEKTPIFQTAGWEQRKKARADKVKNKIEKSQRRKAKRETTLKLNN